jgi:hypothetical protein
LQIFRSRAQNLTSILSNFNLSDVTADCANLTANAQSFEASGMISADNANMLISTCAEVENNTSLTTAFINNATSLSELLFSVLVEMLINYSIIAQNLQSLVQSGFFLPSIRRIFVHS